MLSHARCLELLSSSQVGRVALCTDTGPLVWPVNYSMVEDAIVFRTSPHSLLGTMAWNSRLAFEVDRIDLDREEGWSVLATGTGEMVEDLTAGADPDVSGPAPLGGRGDPAVVCAAALGRTHGS